jgi:hypothetical protein
MGECSEDVFRQGNRSLAGDTMINEKKEELKTVKVNKSDLKTFNVLCEEYELNQNEMFNKILSEWRTSQ